MRVGDLVEFKAGAHGVPAGQNFGIYLDRVKRKGDFYVVLWTTKGRIELKRDALTSRRLAHRLEGELDEATLASRLQQLLKDVARGGPQEPAGDVRDQDLWRHVSGTEGPYSPEELAARHYGGTPQRSHVEAVRAALDRCRPGVGYFRRAEGRGERWVPIPVEAYKAAKREIEALHVLRKRLVKEVQIVEEGWDEPRVAYRGVPLAEAALGGEDEARVETLRDFMVRFVHLDRDTGETTLAGTGIHTIDGFGLLDFARWLATDWLGARGGSISGVFVEFLVESGLLSERAALELVAQRKVRAHADFAWEVSASAQREAERHPATIPPEWLEGRWDLRHNHACYTIDPVDAKDFDDAVAVEAQADGSATLWVHIADVSHYVRKGSLLDDDARRRATSVYLPVRVLPMLPPRLSDDLCSLRAGVDRLAMTVKLTFDADGRLVREEFGESIIRVAANRHYADVDAAIAAGQAPFVVMEAFARRLGAQRRGLALETGERKILFGPDGIIDPTLKHASPATRMIEVFMVAANEAVARRLTAGDVPLPYRCHPVPDQSGVARFNAQMRTMQLPIRIDLPELAEAEAHESEAGVSLLEHLKKGGKLELLKGGFVLGGDDGEQAAEPVAQPPPAVKGLAQMSEEEREARLGPFRNALARAAQQPADVRDLVQLKLLGAMGRAVYTARNLGHFGLGSTCYCHFTSPIRRYPDLLVHRMLRWVIHGRRGEPPHTAEDLEALAAHCSDQGGAAESLERGVVDVAMVFASRDARFQGSIPGLVNGVSKSFVYLTLPGGLEAKLFVADLPGGPYAVDPYESMLFRGALEGGAEDWLDLPWRDLASEEGEIVKVRVRLGDVLKVLLVGRDYVEGRVRVRLAAMPEARAGVLS